MHTIIERTGLIDRRDQRDVRWNGWCQPGVVGKSSQALKATSQHCTQLAGGGWVH